MANTIAITGNLAGPPELRFTPSGHAVADFTVCDTPRKFDKQSNEWADAGDTLFLRCSIWREAAEHLAEQNLDKGQRVTVTGKVKQRNWQDKDGANRTSVECDAESIASHPRRNTQGGQQPRQEPTQAPQQRQGQPSTQQAAQPAQQGGWQQGGASYDEPPF